MYPYLCINAYNRIISTKSPSYCMTTFSATLTNLAVLLLLSRESSCYVNRPIRAPPPLWLQKHSDLRAQDFAHPPDLWHQHRLANVTCARSRRLRGINAALNNNTDCWMMCYRVYVIYIVGKYVFESACRGKFELQLKVLPSVNILSYEHYLSIFLYRYAATPFTLLEYSSL